MQAVCDRLGICAGAESVLVGSASLLDLRPDLLSDGAGAGDQTAQDIARDNPADSSSGFAECRDAARPDGRRNRGRDGSAGEEVGGFE